jgi:hypothetical protein
MSMKLIVPRVGILDPEGSNLSRLAGVPGCRDGEELSLPSDVAQPEQFFENSLSRESCIVVKPRPVSALYSDVF